MSIEDKISGESDTRGEHLFDIIQRTGIYSAIDFGLKALFTVGGAITGYNYFPDNALLGAIAGAAIGYVGIKVALVPGKIRHAAKNIKSLYYGIVGDPKQKRSPGYGLSTA